MVFHRLMCLYPTQKTLFSDFACYAIPEHPIIPISCTELVAKYATNPLSTRVVTRMAEIWALHEESDHADSVMIAYAFDSHFSALFQAQNCDSMKEMYRLRIEPGGENAVVHSCLDIPVHAMLLATKRARIATIPSEKLFAQCSSRCRSVRYVMSRFLACVGNTPCSTIARSVVSLFWLGAYVGSKPAPPTIRATVYASCPIARFATAGLTSREGHAALLEFIAYVRNGERAAWLPRARARAWGLVALPARSLPPPPPVLSPLAFLAHHAAPMGKWSIPTHNRELATQHMVGLGPPTTWAAIRSAGTALDCAAELIRATAAHAPRLSRAATIAASIVIRRISLCASALSRSVTMAQQKAIAVSCRSPASTVCTWCCTLCTTPKGGPESPGIRVNLTTHTIMCARCNSGEGLIDFNFVGRILSYATPAMVLVSAVMCTGCSAITQLKNEHYWGAMPMCAPCFKQCSSAKAEPRECVCGRSAAVRPLFMARDESGRDVTHAMCARHSGIRPHERQSVADLQLLMK
jgi:hypothetical protein